MDYTVQGVLQARILEWVAFPSSRGSSQPRNWTRVSCIAGRFFTKWAMREAGLDLGCILKREEQSTYWQVVLWGLRLWYKHLVAPLTEKNDSKVDVGKGLRTECMVWAWWRLKCWWNIHMDIGVKYLNTLDVSPHWKSKHGNHQQISCSQSHGNWWKRGLRTEPSA